MRFFRFLITRVFLKHLIISLVVTLVISFALLKFLDYYTLHGKSITVPDFTGLHMVELESYALDREFRFLIIDSVFDDNHEKGTIIAQDPLPNSKVKPNRKIYLTLVATQPERVSMPDLVDLTLRQATGLIETYGLEIDSLTYVPDIAQNAVLEQKYNDENIEPGTLLKKGSKINLILGQGIGYEKIPVPFLLGKKQSEAIHALHEVSLNVGVEIFEDGDDTSHARVYRQKPAFSKRTFLNLGQSVDLWYRSDLKFDFNELINNYDVDSIKQEPEKE